MYQPFGGGPRNCPGQHLNPAEAAYTVLRIVQEVSLINGRDSEPWTKLIVLTCTNANGAKVTLTEARLLNITNSLASIYCIEGIVWLSDQKLFLMRILASR